MNNRLQQLLCTIACLLCSIAVYAVPARQVPHSVTQPDGTTIVLQLCGDEYYHYYTTEDGMPVTLCEDGYYRYTTIDAQNRLVASNEIVGKAQLLNVKNSQRVMARHSELYKANKERRVIDVKDGVEGVASMRRAARAAAAQNRKVKGLIILAAFNDKSFTFSQSSIDAKMNNEGYSDEHGSIGSARDYFIAQSYGQFVPNFDVIGPVTLSKNMEYYGGSNSYGHDANPDVMVSEACELASEQGLVNMSDYDLDGDGWVDLVYVIYAGYPESSGAPAETIWPHAWDIYRGAGRTVKIDGVQLGAYACSSELSGNSGSNLEGIGAFCHEYSHTLGIPDWYDVDGSGGMGVSMWSLMDGGCYAGNAYVPVGYNAYERSLCGWLEFNELVEETSISMPDVSSDKSAAYKITSSNENQFITLETRCRKGWDTYLPAEGMMVIAVDYDKRVWDQNGPNDDPGRQRFKLIPADDSWSTNDLYGDLYPYGGNTALTSSSNPKMQVYNNTIYDKPITNIAYNDGITTFDFKKDVPTDEPNGVLADLLGTYHAFANSGFQNQPDEEWSVDISIDAYDSNKIWIHPICMFGNLDAQYISPIYATYDATDNTLLMPLGQVLYEDSQYKMVIGATEDGQEIYTDGMSAIMHINKTSGATEISFAQGYIFGVGNALANEWWYQALTNIVFSKSNITYLEGTYSAFANSGIQDQPDEEWLVNVTIDSNESNKIWIQPILAPFAGLIDSNIKSVYAYVNGNTIELPLGQTLFSGAGYNIQLGSYTGDVVLSGSAMATYTIGDKVQITWNDMLIAYQDGYYQALYNITFTKNTGAVSTQPYGIELSQTTFVLGTPAGIELADVSVLCDDSNASFAYELYDSQNMQSPYIVVDNKLVSTEPIADSDAFRYLRMKVTNIATGESCEREFDITIDTSNAQFLAGNYNAFAGSAFSGYPDEEWQVNITVDEHMANKVWIHPICMFSNLDAQYISPVYAIYNEADNTLSMPMGQILYEDSDHQMVIGYSTDGSSIDVTNNVVMQISQSDVVLRITFADDFYFGVGDALHNQWWYQALFGVRFTSALVDELVIYDDVVSYEVTDKTYCNELTYIRHFDNTDWQAWYVPFEVPYETLATELEVAYLNNVHQYDDDNDGEIDLTELEAIKVTDGILRANYPYLVRAIAPGEKELVVEDVMVQPTYNYSYDCASMMHRYYFTGTYNTISSDLLQQNNVYTLQQSMLEVPTDETYMLGAFRWYMQIENRGSATRPQQIKLSIRDKNHTDVDDVISDDNNAPVEYYDLSGRRIENPSRGIYIMKQGTTVRKVVLNER